MFRLGCNYLFKCLSYSIRLRACSGRNLNCLSGFKNGRGILIQGNLMLLAWFIRTGTLCCYNSSSQQDTAGHLEMRTRTEMNLWFGAWCSAGVYLIHIPVPLWTFFRQRWKPTTGLRWIQEGVMSMREGSHETWSQSALNVWNSTPDIVSSLPTHLSQEGSAILRWPEVWLQKATG